MKWLSFVIPRKPWPTESEEPLYTIATQTAKQDLWVIKGGCVKRGVTINRKPYVSKTHQNDAHALFVEHVQEWVCRSLYSCLDLNVMSGYITYVYNTSTTRLLHSVR